MTSPYHAVAANMRENGFHVMPVRPGFKVPGAWNGSAWDNLPGWSKFCDAQPPAFLHDKWEDWPDAGVCVAHGNIIGLDLDTDRKDVAEALHRAVVPPNVQRRGRKGWLGYYRPGAGLDGLTARVRWYDGDTVTCELLLHGTQSVLPPTIHPETNLPYAWLTPDTLENTDIGDLPEFTGDDLAALDREFTKIGLTRQAPRKVNITDYVASASGHDLEKTWGRSINDRAMEPAAIDAWWPALALPKTKQRGGGVWSAVPSWRPSGSGRMLADRNPNIGITPQGIKDFAKEESYTPLDLVCAARSCGVKEAAEWLEQYIRPEEVAGVADLEEMGVKKFEPAKPVEREADDTDYDRPTLEFLTTAEARNMPNVEPAVVGVLDDLYRFMNFSMRRHWPEAAMLVSLNVFGVAIGRNFATWTNLRSNLYTVVLAKSGWGKSSIYGPAVDLMRLAGMQDTIGAERIMSDSALITEMVQGDHKKIYFLDEFGHMLQRCYDKGAGGHSRKIITEFTNLYSKAGGTYGGSAYADGRDKSTIENPHLNIFGMATPGQFWDAFGSGAIEDGTLPRFSVLKATTRPPRKQIGTDHFKRVSEMCEALAPKLGAVYATYEEKGNLRIRDVRYVQPSDAADDVFRKIEDDAESISIQAETKMPDRDFGGILARVAETAAKLALIFAVSRNIDAPMIERGDIVAGRRLAWYFAHVAIEGAMTHVADNPHEAMQQKILDFIRKGPGCQRTKSQVMQRTKLLVRDLDAIMSSLVASELVAVDEVSRSDGRPGRPRVIYTAMAEGG